MGQTHSSDFYDSHPVNYDCPVCMNSNKLPNIAGRFFLISETECQCNGCKTTFEKSRFYKKYPLNAVNVKLDKTNLKQPAI